MNYGHKAWITSPLPHTKSNLWYLIHELGHISACESLHTLLAYTAYLMLIVFAF